MKYKILVVDDSAFQRKMIREMLSSDSELEVVGEAEDGRQAVKMAEELSPDAVIMDLVMPEPDGLWTVENILKKKPVPIVVFSGISSEHSEIAAEAFQYGVLDIVKKTENSHALRLSREELICKVKAAAKSKNTFQTIYKKLAPSPHSKISSVRPATSAIAVIASAGAPGVLRELLQEFSRKCLDVENLNSALLIALHMPQEFLISYVKAVSATSSCPTRLAKDGDIIRAKRIYFSPGDATLTLRKTRAGVVTKIEKLKIRLQPDFDTFFKSVAESFGPKTIGVVLSGMGRYGLEGAREIKKVGGRIFVQEPSTAGVSAMPQAILDDGLADECLLVQEMPAAILKNV